MVLKEGNRPGQDAAATLPRKSSARAQVQSRRTPQPECDHFSRVQERLEEVMVGRIIWPEGIHAGFARCQRFMETRLAKRASCGAAHARHRRSHLRARREHRDIQHHSGAGQWPKVHYCLHFAEPGLSNPRTEQCQLGTRSTVETPTFGPPMGKSQVRARPVNAVAAGAALSSRAHTHEKRTLDCEIGPYTPVDVEHSSTAAGETPTTPAGPGKKRRQQSRLDVHRTTSFAAGQRRERASQSPGTNHDSPAGKRNKIKKNQSGDQFRRRFNSEGNVPPTRGDSSKK
ncbi:hypothetical protein HPB48_014147 [Haemaphysalis longicornis]|uniref:Uncharacterized protein n=1 Tax=Haemaphysalis longicornis TaxID=44386 RepID=A0A9J6FJR1_HAELO|nr:hypothetical protein HPB48_014147 [Haemaphysalis longicornis]